MNALEAAMADAVAEVEESTTQVNGASSSKEGVEQRKEGQFDEFWGGVVYQGERAAQDENGRGDATEEVSYKLPEGPAFADEKAFERELRDSEVANMVHYSSASAQAAAKGVEDDEFAFDEVWDESGGAAATAGAGDGEFEEPAAEESSQAAAARARELLLQAREREEAEARAEGERLAAELEAERSRVVAAAAAAAAAPAELGGTAAAPEGRAPEGGPPAVGGAAHGMAALRALRAQYGEEALEREALQAELAALEIPEEERAGAAAGGGLDEAIAEEDEEEEEEDEEDEDEEEDDAEAAGRAPSRGETPRPSAKAAFGGKTESVPASAAPEAGERGDGDGDGDAVADEWAAVEATQQEVAGAAAVAEQSHSGIGVKNKAIKGAPMWYPEALRWWKAQDLEAFGEGLVEEDVAALSCWAKCTTKALPRVADAPEERRQLLLVARVPLATSLPEHDRQLQSVYKGLTGAAADAPRMGHHWEDIGFQGTDPATDLRSGGMLTLLLTLGLLHSDRATAEAALRLSRDARQNFPFMAVAVNITVTCMGAVRNRALWPVCEAHGSVFAGVLRLYCALWWFMRTQWGGRGLTITDFHAINLEMQSRARTPVALVRQYEAALAQRTSAGSGQEGGFLDFEAR